MPEYLLGVDCGNDFIRAGIYTVEGEEIGTNWFEGEINSPRPEYYQIDFQKCFESILKLIKELIQLTEVDPNKIKAISFTGSTNGLFLVDEKGNPVYDGILGIDKRAKSLVDIWRENGIEEKAENITRQKFWAGHTVAIIKWFDRNKADVLENAKQIFFLKDYIRYKFCGDASIENTELSVTGLFDIHKRTISKEILECIGISKYQDLFPKSISSSEVCGEILEEVAMKTGLKKGTPVVAGINRILASSIAAGLTGNTKEVKKYLIINIGLMIWSQYSIYTEDSFLSSLTSIGPNDDVLHISQLSGTSLANLYWFVDDFLKGEKESADVNGISIYQICDEAVLNTLPQDSSVIFLPYVIGSDFSSDSGGAVFNISMNDSRDNIIRAVYEGVVFDIRRSINHLLEDVFEEMIIRALSAEGESIVWWQMLADVLGKSVEVIESGSPCSLAAAVCAGVGVKVYSSFDEGAEKMLHIKGRYEPNMELKTYYDEKYELYLFYLNKFVKK